MSEVRKGGRARGRSGLARLRKTHVRKTRMVRHGTRTFGQLAARPSRAALTAVHDAAPTDAAIDGNRTAAPRTEDVHGQLLYRSRFRPSNLVRVAAKRRLPPVVTIVTVSRWIR